jgi:hypothetical protein
VSLQEFASVADGRLLHCRAPKEFFTLSKESTGNAQPYGFFKCLLNPVT